MEQKSIILIDDDKFILNVFSQILQKKGYLVDAVETGQEAMDKLQKRRYNLALIDVVLPDVDGVDLLTKIHSLRPDMLKIVITGFPDLEDASRIIDQGATAYLVKPVKTDELVALIKEKLN